MTDKLADALNIALKALRTLHRNGISDDIAGTALNDIQEALTAHEAAKAAAPDDVREAAVRVEAFMLDVQFDFDKRQMQDDVDTLIKAALRQQQGVPMDTMAELLYLRYCHEHRAVGARWELNESKDVWREKALALLNAQGV